MRDYKVTTKSGNHFVTGFNGSFQEARDYYLGADGKGRTYVAEENEFDGTETRDTYSKVEALYDCRMIGRMVGAIGETHPCGIYLFADSPEAAQIACYEHFEHITNFTAGAL